MTTLCLSDMQRDIAAQVAARVPVSPIEILNIVRTWHEDRPLADAIAAQSCRQYQEDNRK